MVTITYNDKQIRTSGHANYAEHGKDIVCAAVSVLCDTLATTGTMESIEETVIVTTDNEEALKAILNGLRMVAVEYPQYVEIKE